MFLSARVLTKLVVFISCWQMLNLMEWIVLDSRCRNIYPSLLKWKNVLKISAAYRCFLICFWVHFAYMLPERRACFSDVLAWCHLCEHCSKPCGAFAIFQLWTCFQHFNILWRWNFRWAEKQEHLASSILLIWLWVWLWQVFPCWEQFLMK